MVDNQCLSGQPPNATKGMQYYSGPTLRPSDLHRAWHTMLGMPNAQCLPTRLPHQPATHCGDCNRHHSMMHNCAQLKLVLSCTAKDCSLQCWDPKRGQSMMTHCSGCADWIHTPKVSQCALWPCHHMCAGCSGRMWGAVEASQAMSTDVSMAQDTVQAALGGKRHVMATKKTLLCTSPAWHNITRK